MEQKGTGVCTCQWGRTIGSTSESKASIRSAMDEVPSGEFTWVVFVQRWAETSCLLAVQGLWPSVWELTSNEQTVLFLSLIHI